MSIKKQQYYQLEVVLSYLMTKRGTTTPTRLNCWSLDKLNNANYVVLKIVRKPCTLADNFCQKVTASRYAKDRISNHLDT